MREFTDKEKDEIINMYLETKDIEKMMDIFDSDEHDLRIILKENQVDRQYNKFSDELYNRIFQLYNIDNKQQKDICYDLLISNTGINGIIDRAGIPRKGYSISNRRYNRNSNYFDSIDTPNKAYILGLLYADGCNHYDGAHPYSITLSLQESDKKILDKINKELEYEGPLRLNPLNVKNKNYKNQYIFCVTDQHMSSTLRDIGMVQKKSLILEFPISLSSDLYRHFWRGYFDGDGNIYYYDRYGKCSTQTVMTFNMCQKLSKILDDLNIKNSIKHPKQCSHNTFILSTNGNKSSYKFLSWMYEDAELKFERKYEQYLDFCKKYTNSHINLTRNNDSSE